MNSRRFKTRKSRTKAKKPKFLSLRLQLSPDETKTPEKPIEIPTSAAATDACHQLDLIPPHPENLVEEKYIYTHDQDNVVYFSAGDGEATTTLTGLLDASTITTSSSNNKNISITSLSASDSLTYAYRGHSELARTALRNWKREPSEEKWVYYSEVVERKVKEEEVTSCAADLRCKDPTELGIAEFFGSTRYESLEVRVRRCFTRALRSAAINYGGERKGVWCRGGSGERLSDRGVTCFDVG